jgi:hypothetical protein
MFAELTVPKLLSFREAFALGLLSLCLAAARAACGQEVTANITGTVVDPTHAVIIGAALVAWDIERGTVYRVRTNSVGVFDLARVPVGTYELKVEAPGFQSVVYPSLTLPLNQTARVDFQLNLGSATETMDVISSPPLLHTDTSQLSTIVDARSNVDLPLLSRNYIQLTLLAPGTVTPNPQTLSNGDGPATAGRPYVNGNREQANNFLLDGIDNNQVSDNLIGLLRA